MVSHSYIVCLKRCALICEISLIGAITKLSGTRMVAVGKDW